MKTITFKKKIEVDETIEFPTISFVAEKKRVNPNGDASWLQWVYTARFNGMTKEDFFKATGMPYRAIDKMLEEHVKERNKNACSSGSIDVHCYSGRDLGLPELPKVEDSKFVDEHEAFINMFRGL